MYLSTYSSLSNKRNDGIKVVRGQNLKINKRWGWNKRGVWGFYGQRNNHNSVNFEARQTFKVPKFSKNYS